MIRVEKIEHTWDVQMKDCCNQAAKDAESILDWYDNMGMDHEGLLIGWSIIIIFGMIILFIASFVAFASSFG